MKQAQRSALTKETQARMATGGGPEVPEVEIDPDIAAIVPDLMTHAPVKYSSNIIDTVNHTLENHEDSALEYQDVEYLLDDIDVPSTEPVPSSSSEAPVQTPKKLCVAGKRNRSESSTSASKPAGTTTSMHDIVAERVKALLEQDRELFAMKKQHQERITKLQEGQQNNIHLLQVQHLLKIQELEMRKATAEAELAELRLERERETI